MSDYSEHMINAKKNLRLLEDSLLHNKPETAKFAANEVKKEVDRVIQWIEENK